jgi:hypothetical protein
LPEREETAVRKRNHHVTLAVDSEHDHLKKKAKLAGMPVDPFVRTLIRASICPPAHLTPIRIARELSAIGNNVNQIAHLPPEKGIYRRRRGRRYPAVRQAWRFGKDAY